MENNEGIEISDDEIQKKIDTLKKCAVSEFYIVDLEFFNEARLGDDLYTCIDIQDPSTKEIITFLTQSDGYVSPILNRKMFKFDYIWKESYNRKSFKQDCLDKVLNNELIMPEGKAFATYYAKVENVLFKRIVEGCFINHDLEYYGLESLEGHLKNNAEELTWKNLGINRDNVYYNNEKLKNLQEEYNKGKSKLMDLENNKDLFPKECYTKKENELGEELSEIDKSIKETKENMMGMISTILKMRKEEWELESQISELEERQKLIAWKNELLSKPKTLYEPTQKEINDKRPERKLPKIFKKIGKVLKN